MSATDPEQNVKEAGTRPDFLAGLLDSTSLVVYLKDAEGRYIYVNRRYEKLSTVPREALLGKGDHDLFPPKVADLFRAQDAQVSARRAPVEFEETIPLPDGEHSFITEKFPLFDEKGAVCAVGGFCTEVTAQKNQADESLAEERERLAVTLRSISEGIIATDTNGHIILLNSAAAKLTVTSPAAAAGRAVDSVLLAADAAQAGLFGRLVQKALAGAAAPHADQDVVIFSLDATKRTLQPAVAAVRDRRGKIIGAVLTLRDVTAQRQADAELAKARNLESLGFLAGGIAHDFNNLLTGIVGNLGLLGKDLPESGPLRAALEDATTTSRKAAALARQLLTFAGGGEPARKPLALGPLLADTARLVLHDSRLESRVTCPDDLWPVEADESQLAQVIENLLINAREAMPGGGTVRLLAENYTLAAPLLRLPAGRYVRLTVQDDGPGIPSESLPRIFNPYFSSKERGSGLGLAIAYAVIQRHGGHIQVKSAVGQGTTFTILLPATGKPVPGSSSGFSQGSGGAYGI